MSYKAPKLDVLVTRRLTLRPPLQVDAESIATSLANPNVSRMLSKVPHPYGLKDAEDWISEQTGRQCVFTVHRETLIGVVHVRNAPDMPMLGYWLAEQHWGNGYITEAARAALSHAFKVYDVDAIASYAIDDNAASLHVMEKLGFEKTGTGTAFNATRGAGYPTTKTALKRTTFERMFGSLDEAKAA